MIEHAEELKINTDALGAWGYSAGGHLAALLSTDPSEGLPRLKVCVSGAAPCDLTRIPANSRVLSSLLGGTRAQFPERYKQASPVTYVSSDDPPIFLFHGSKDWLVSPEASLIMKESLDNHNVTNEHMVVPDKGHLMTFVDKQALALSYAFLRRYLAPLDISIAEIPSDAENQCTVQVRSKAFHLPDDITRLEQEIGNIHPTSINVSLQSDASNKERVLKQILGIINPLGIELYEGNQRLLGGTDPQ
jgi:predicted esterase